MSIKSVLAQAKDVASSILIAVSVLSFLIGALGVAMSCIIMIVKLPMGQLNPYTPHVCFASAALLALSVIALEFCKEQS